MYREKDWISSLKLEEPLSQETIICGNRINDSKVWWLASRNYNGTEVFGCRHAIKFRDRLGSGDNGGIPLWAELKSYLGVAIDSKSKTEILFAAHSRANTRFCNEAIVKALGLDVTTTKINTIIDPEYELNNGSTNDLKLSSQSCYGKVNPFNLDIIFKNMTEKNVELEDIYQIFDESLKLDGGYPNTVMSNLGDRRLAFEIFPNDLINIIKKLSPNSIISNIAEPSPIWLGLIGKFKKDYWLQFPPPGGPKIGILTGNAPESGITLWEDILETFRDQFTNLADVFMPEIHIHSLPQMGLSMDLVKREKQVWDEMEKSLILLLEAGCSIITLACNTTIYYEPKIVDLCNKYGARFVSIAEACMPAIKDALNNVEGNQSVGLIGIGPVVDMVGSYSGYKRHLDVERVNVTPCPGDKLAFAVKNSGGSKRELLTEFRRLLKKELPDEQVIVLALTEVSMVYREHKNELQKKGKEDKSKIFIDPLLELGRFISYLYLKRGYKENPVCQIPEDFPIEQKF